MGKRGKALRLQLIPLIAIIFFVLSISISPMSVYAPIAGTGGDVTLIAPPPSVRPNVLQSNTEIFAFPEQQSRTLLANLPVEATLPGTYSSPTQLTPGSIPVGTVIDSYFLHFDAIGSGHSELFLSGSVTLDSKIIGVIIFGNHLDFSDSLGNPSTVYQPSAFNRGYELGADADQFTISSDLRTVTVRNNAAYDQMRIITLPGPDLDADDVVDTSDNCPDDFNPEQIDSDGDGSGDACDCEPDDASSRPGARELCDGLDNNCDGAVDEFNPEGGHFCDTGNIGVCSLGTTQCQSGELICIQQLEASPEVCDEFDNDCDGSVDEGFGTGVTCDGEGACGVGVVECLDFNNVVCSTEVGGSDNQATNEICDGLDNDCNGEVDEVFGIGDTCDGEGACGVGVVECSASGDLMCSTEPGGSADESTDELCDGLDNNCDGFVDEDEPICDDGNLCTVDVCNQSEGQCDFFPLDCSDGDRCTTDTCDESTGSCVNEPLTCDDGNQCTVDVCNREDGCVNHNIEDGTSCADDNACNGDEICQAGTCTAGDTLDCDDTNVCTADSCDMVNGCANDPVADGTIPDEADVCIVPGLLGVCANGIDACFSGGLDCLQTVFPTTETCDGLDDDCDGEVDERDGGGSVCAVPVLIDVKPGGDQSSVSCKNLKGNVPVAVLSDDGFDATTIDIELVSMSLVGSSPIPVDVTEIHDKLHSEDVDGDGDLDAVMHLDKAGVCEATGDAPLKESVEVRLSGETIEGVQFEGISDVTIINR